MYLKLELLNLNLVKLMLIISVAVFGSLAVAAQTVPNNNLVTFAQFVEREGTQDFLFSSISRRDAFYETVAGGSPIYFRYQNIQNLPAPLQGFQDAHLYLSFASKTGAIATSGVVIQPFDQAAEIRIVRDTPAPSGGGNRTNLLTISIRPIGSANPVLTGTNGGNSATYSATTPDHIVIFSSDFVGFNMTTQRNLGLSFSSVIANLSQNSPDLNNFLKNFTAAGSGTFASNPPPFVLTPTASLVTVGGQVRTSSGNPIPNALVTMTSANGNMRYVRTNSEGRYSFSDTEVGQVYVLSAQKKSLNFQSHVLYILEDIPNLDFVSQ